MKKLLALGLILSSSLLVACNNKTESSIKIMKKTDSVGYETSLVRNDVREVEGNALILDNYNIILDWTKQDSGWGLVENTKPVTFVDIIGQLGVYVQNDSQLYEVTFDKGLEEWGYSSSEFIKYIKDADILHRFDFNKDDEIIAKNVDKVYNDQYMYSEYKPNSLLYSTLDDKTSLYDVNHDKVLDLKDYNITVDDIVFIKGDLFPKFIIIVTNDNVFINHDAFNEDEILQYKEMEKTIKELQKKDRIKDIQCGGTVEATVLLENGELYRITLIR